MLWERNREKVEGEFSVYPVSSKDIDYNVLVGKGSEKGERKEQKYGNTEWRKCPFLSVFYSDIFFVYYDVRQVW